MLRVCRSVPTPLPITHQDRHDAREVAGEDSRMGKAKPDQGRFTAQLEGDFVVLLIGSRPEVRHPIRWFRDVGGRRGMQHMLTYLTKHPEKGLLGFEMGFPTIVQYWRSYEQLE